MTNTQLATVTLKSGRTYTGTVVLFSTRAIAIVTESGQRMEFLMLRVRKHTYNPNA